MATVCEELIEAYERERAVYDRIQEVVAEQSRLMTTAPDSRTVILLCELVQGLMGEIAAIEDGIQPLKTRWEQADRSDPDGELDAVLAGIQDAIQSITAAQERVQNTLLGHVRRDTMRARQARADINASRAGRAYGLSEGGSR